MKGARRLFPAALVVVLTACGSPASPGALRTQLVLTKSSVVAGPPIEGTLLVTNPGDAIDLTTLSRPFGHVAHVYHCRPGFAVYLTNGSIDNEPGFRADCSSRPYVLDHGANRLRFELSTTWSMCTETSGGVGTPKTPVCLPSGGMPLLPAGTYQAKVVWSEWVPVPAPAAPTVVHLSRG